MSDFNEPEGRSTGLSRRTVVRTAANAAWMVPAISLVTEAPALAASGDVISFGSGSGSWTGSGILGFTLSMSIPVGLTTKHASQAKGLTVAVTVPATAKLLGLPVVLTAHAPAGWTVTPATGAGGTFTFTKAANTQAPANFTFAPTFTTGILSGLVGKPLPPNSKVTLVGWANSTVTTPPPAGFTDTGKVGGGSASGAFNLTN